VCCRTVNLGKFGSFNSNALIGRPYHLTYEFLDKADDQTEEGSKLRIVPTAELTAETLFVEATQDEQTVVKEGVENNTADENGDVTMRNNRLTIDDPSRQGLTMDEIEELKKNESGKEVIARIMASHTAIDEKTVYSLAKYSLRKSRKYIRRFTVLPLDVDTLAEFMIVKDPPKIMDLRSEILSLITNWANVHHAGTGTYDSTTPQVGGGRWIVVDDTGGLIVAAMAEKMGILYPYQSSHEESGTVMKMEIDGPETVNPENVPSIVQQDNSSGTSEKQQVATGSLSNGNKSEHQEKPEDTRDLHQSATNNTITLIHPSTQPNISLLRYFGFVAEDATPDHPLFYHLHSLTWLQLLDPVADSSYRDIPEDVPEEELATWKSNRRGAYYRKRRRWQRVRRVVETTQAGGFDGLLVASFMDPVDVLNHLAPLVKGGGQVVVYSPTVESLTILMDLYSRERRTAYLHLLQEKVETGDDSPIDHEDFPVDPTILLHPTLQTARAVEWQVLPSRTHPLMTSRGGSEGYLFAATRVLPAQGFVSARGKFQKKRKAEESASEEEKKKVRSAEPVD
jgi:tRNA (adenine58-N1)-methyltransferase non-catalytic subunit